MQIKIKTFNSDGTVAFDGVFSEQEASLILEVGTNYLLSQGVIPFTDEQLDDEDDEDGNFVEGSETVQ